MQFHVNVFLIFFLLLDISPIPSIRKLYNFSKQISLSYKNRLFFFHKIIHIITSQWYNLFVKVNSKAVLKVNIVRETEMWSLAPYSSTPPFPITTPPTPTHLHRYDSSESIRWIRGNPLFPPHPPHVFSGLQVLHILVEARFSTLKLKSKSYSSAEGCDLYSQPH